MHGALYLWSAGQGQDLCDEFGVWGGVEAFSTSSVLRFGERSEGPCSLLSFSELDLLYFLHLLILINFIISFWSFSSTWSPSCVFVCSLLKTTCKFSSSQAFVAGIRY